MQVKPINDIRFAENRLEFSIIQERIKNEKKYKSRNTTCLLLAALSIIILPLLFAQQDQNLQRPDPEIAVLKKRISELENKLQTVENVEQIELMVKLAEANTKLANADIDTHQVQAGIKRC